MTMLKIYLWAPKQRLLVPQMAETDSGFFVEVEPLAVYESHDIPHWKKHIHQSLIKGMVKVETPDAAQEPGSMILEKLDLSSWAEFERHATLFTIHLGSRYTTIYATGAGEDGMWSHALMTERKFHSRAPLEMIVDAIAGDIIKHPGGKQTAASPDYEQRPIETGQAGGIMTGAAETASAQESQASSGESKKTVSAVLTLALIVAIGFGLRLYHIGNHGLFVDEVYSVLIASGKADPELADFDAARPLYFLLLKIWLMISSSESWMRFLSVIFGTANIALTYKMGKTFCNSRVGLAAALLMALSPMEVHYSQQVRMYTMGTTLVLCGTLALFRAYAETSKKWLAAWALSRVLMVLTLPLTGMLMLSDWLYALDRRKDSKMLPAMFIATAAIFALWSPFIYITVMAHASEYDMWRATLDVPTAFDLFTLLINFTATAIPLQESGGPPAFDTFTWAYLITFPLVLGTAIAFCHKQAKMLWCCAYGLLPLGLIFAISQIDACLLITRYTMFTGPFVMILLAYGWEAAWSRLKPAGFGIAGVYLLAMTSCLHFFYTHPVHEDWKPVADYLTAHAKPDEDIVVWNYHSHYLMGYYFHGTNRVTDMRIISRPEPGDDPDNPIVRIQFMEIKPKSGQHLWIVSREAAAGWTSMHEVYGLYQQALERKFKVLHHEHLIMTDVYEVVVP